MGDVTYNSDHVPMPFGMHNTGATCWFNTILQCLFSCSSFNLIVMTRCAKFCNIGSWYKKMFDFPQVTETTCRIVPKPTPDPDIAALSGYILDKIKRTVGYSNEDATGVLPQIIDLFKCPKLDVLFYTRYTFAIKCRGCGAETKQPDSTTFPVQITNFPPIKTRVEFCNFFKNHISKVENWKCEKCNHRHIEINRQETLCMAREVIPIVFHKIMDAGNRWFPQYLVFNKTDGTSLRYKLVAKVQHSGSWNPITSGGGHYYAEVYRHGKWYIANDASVSVMSAGTPPAPVSTSDEQSSTDVIDQPMTNYSQTIMLFYHMLASEDIIPEKDPNEL
jgi:hypothetical protein